MPPVRDEESETQRKAHAKRVRETRRSTQGVTLEDLKSAEQLVKKKQQLENQQRTSELQQLVASQQTTQKGGDNKTSSPVANGIYSTFYNDLFKEAFSIILHFQPHLRGEKVWPTTRKVSPKFLLGSYGSIQLSLR